ECLGPEDACQCARASGNIPLAELRACLLGSIRNNGPGDWKDRGSCMSEPAEDVAPLPGIRRKVCLRTVRRVEVLNHGRDVAAAFTLYELIPEIMREGREGVYHVPGARHESLPGAACGRDIGRLFRRSHAAKLLSDGVVVGSFGLASELLRHCVVVDG